MHRSPMHLSFTRGRTIRNMLVRSTVTTEAKSALQKHLMSVRSSHAGSETNLMANPNSTPADGNEDRGEEDGSSAKSSSRRSVLSEALPSKFGRAGAPPAGATESQHSLHDVARVVMKMAESLEAIGADVNILKRQVSMNAALNA